MRSSSRFSAVRLPWLPLLCLVWLSLPPAPVLGAETPEEGEPASLEALPFFFALSVKDVDASADWYGRLLGLTVRRSVDLGEGRPRIRLLAGEGSSLELVEAAGSLGIDGVEPPIERRFLLRGVFKVGFRVPDLEETDRRLAKLEIPLRGRVFTESDGSMRSLQVEDPDGNVLQFFGASRVGLAVLRGPRPGSGG